MSNSSLNKSKIKKDDEFYTRYEDIAKEVAMYPRAFVGKTVYCNCDNPEWSNFPRFFVANMTKLGIKRVIATGLGAEYMLDVSSEMAKAHSSEWCMLHGRRLMKGTGSFDSPESLTLLKQADIVVTNPPFSLLKYYVPLMMMYGKDVLLVVPLHSLKYKETFPYIASRKLASGITPIHIFVNPNGSIKKFGYTMWETTLHSPFKKKRLECSPIKYSPAKYDFFEGTRILFVKTIKEIPYGWTGAMAVPLTALEYDLSGWKILGIASHGTDSKWDIANPLINGKLTYCRLVIQIK